MTGRLRVAVALCTYNGAPYLPEQLASIGAQTRVVDEIVARDDGSTDGSADILAAFGRGSRIPVRLLPSGERLGPTKNFEEAVLAADADVIFFCDQDDVWMPDKVASVTDLLHRQPEVSCVLSDAALVGPDLRDQHRTLWESVGFVPRRSLLEPGDFIGAFLQRTIGFGTTMAFRATLREYALPFGSPFGHDSWVALLAAALGRVALIPRPLLRYRQHVGQVSGGTSRRRLSPSRVSAQTPVAASLRDLAARMERWQHVAADRGCFEDVLGHVQAKARHVALRATLPDAAHLRAPRVLCELASRRYSLYSNGVRSALYDALTGPRRELA